ncbi:MAG: DUF4286 family protein [Odoribacteraceae bacterium]|jgi:hypothetical protein|nr:DUF4286 family protein [Odoribacteraceae bacterium]
MRIVYNITFHVNKGIEKEWVATIWRTYIPFARSVTSSPPLFTRIKSAEEPDPSFSLQLFFDREEAYRYFVEKKLEASLSLLSRRFPGDFLYFCTTLEEVSHED